MTACTMTLMTVIVWAMNQYNINITTIALMRSVVKHPLLNTVSNCCDNGKETSTNPVVLGICGQFSQASVVCIIETAIILA